MSDQHGNPFVLPGLGQHSDLSGNPLLASMEMMRQAWAGLTGPGGLASSLPMAPPMNVEDLERRIAELRSVENWLRMNLSMLSSTIQGMEVQRSTINTLRAFVDSAASMDLGALRDSGAASPLEVVLGLKPAPGKAKAAPSGDAARDGGKGPAQDHAGDAAPAEAAAQDAAPPFAGMSEQMGAARWSASKAWWDLLQQQFGQIAAATAATMPAAAPSRWNPKPTSRRPSRRQDRGQVPRPGAGQAGLEGRRPRQARRSQGGTQAVRLAPAPDLNRNAQRLLRGRCVFNSDLYAQCSDSRRRTGQAHAVRPSQSAAHAGRQAHVGARAGQCANSRPPASRWWSATAPTASSRRLAARKACTSRCSSRSRAQATPCSKPCRCCSRATAGRCDALVLYGDVPLVQPDTLRRLLAARARWRRRAHRGAGRFHRLRPHRARRRRQVCHRRAQGRLRGRARHQGSQHRHPGRADRPARTGCPASTTTTPRASTT